MKRRIHRKPEKRPRFHRRTEPGAPPGTIRSDPKAAKGEVHVMAFDSERFVESHAPDLKTIRELLIQWPVTWINVDGVGDAGIITEIGALFNLHKLALEDVVHVHQRAKTESYGEYYFIVARMPLLDQPGQSEQISLFFGERFVITFQERPGGDCLELIRTRIRSGWSRVRAVRPDELAYALLDTIVDHYFPLVELCGERLDEVESEVFESTSAAVMPRIHAVKRDLLHVRRVIWPLRDALSVLLREPSPLISEGTHLYLRDVADHTIQILDLVESYREIAAGVTDVYLSRVTYRTNEIMKVLTIITTIFIPLSFIVGVYGMNFDPDASPWSMPELRWAWGYPVVLLLMFGVAGTMLLFFYRRGWLGRDRDEE